MKIALKPVALAMLVATTQLAGLACAEAANIPAAPAANKTAQSWAQQQYGEAGNEFKVAARRLESGAGWAGGEAKAGASATAADTRALGDKLASGAAWTRGEVAKGFESLSQGIDALGRKIGGNKSASSFNAGA